MNKRQVVPKAPQSQARIPEPLLERIHRIERAVTDPRQPKIAAFDLDNTLLIGDIGDAVLVQLKIDEKTTPLSVDKTPIPLTWKEYEFLIREKGKKVAYKEAVTAAAGIPLETFIQTTRRVMATDSPELVLPDEDVKVPVPRPNPIMQALVKHLEKLDYRIFVVSASNHYSVCDVAETYFGIPGKNVFGMKPTLIKNPQHGLLIGDGIDGPITVSEGKVEAYRLLAGNVPPLLTAGDSTTDFEILNLVDQKGLCIWVGDNNETYETIRQRLAYTDTAYFFDSNLFSNS